MKIFFRGLILAVLVLGCQVGLSQAQVQFGISIGDQGLKDFYLSIGAYYHVPEQQVVVVRQRSLPDEELPVVFFIAQRAHVSSDEIVRLRLGGESWMDIALHFGIGPDAFYVPVSKSYGPPYGHAYGYYKHHRHQDWKQIHLSDSDVVNFVNLRFLSERYHCTPDQVIQWRTKGRKFYEINENLRHPGRGGDESEEEDHDKGKRHGHGHGDDNHDEDEVNGHGHGHGHDDADEDHGKDHPGDDD